MLRLLIYRLLGISASGILVQRNDHFAFSQVQDHEYGNEGRALYVESCDIGRACFISTGLYGFQPKGLGTYATNDSFGDVRVPNKPKST